jgi:segregation and condensation protein B
MLMDKRIESQIEAYLFWKGEPVSRKELKRLIEIDDENLNRAIESLKENYIDRGVWIIENDDEITITTNPKYADIIEKIKKDELARELSKASSETLSIILYRGPIKRSDIDFIRGVNSQFSLRSLLVRGLIDKTQDPKDERVNLYKVSTGLLQHLGIQKKEDMPDYEKINSEINDFIKSFETEGKSEELESTE